MNGFFNVTTIPRAVLAGFIFTCLALGMTSFYRLMVGNEGMVTLNSLIPCVVAGLIAGAMGYLFRDQRIMALKARGRLDPDSDGSELPIGGPPSTIPRLLGYIAMMTFVVQGIIAALSMAGLWWSRSADWGDWFVTLAVVTVIGLMTYFRAGRDRTEKALASSSPSDNFHGIR